MTLSPKLPDPKKIQHGIDRLREACQILDNLNLILDDAIALVEAENRLSPLYIHRLNRAKRLIDSQQTEDLTRIDSDFE